MYWPFLSLPPYSPFRAPQRPRSVGRQRQRQAQVDQAAQAKRGHRGVQVSPEG